MSDEVRVLTRKSDPDSTLDSGLRAHKHARSPEIDLTEYFYETGMKSSDTPHGHAFATAVHVTSGKFELKYTGGGAYVLQAGDSYVALAGQEHMVTCLAAGSYVVAKPVGAAAAATAEADHGHEHGHEHH
jgi:quercetin dioxygenase-like cupin family protein